MVKCSFLSRYVVTRWYRAPEIMLACRQYSKPVDVWSVGCIMAEVLARKPFLPGNDYIEQVCLAIIAIFLSILLRLHLIHYHSLKYITKLSAYVDHKKVREITRT